MDLWIKIGTVFLTSIVELWAAIPVGFSLGLSPVLIAAASAAGSTLAAAAVLFFGQSLRAWMLRRWERRSKKREGALSRFWRKYGAIGIGLLSPLITGAPLGAAMGVAMGEPSGKLFGWMAAGIVLWSILLTAAVAMGLLSLQS